jgi:hypothetical protein
MFRMHLLFSVMSGVISIGGFSLHSCNLQLSMMKRVIHITIEGVLLILIAPQISGLERSLTAKNHSSVLHIQSRHHLTFNGNFLLQKPGFVTSLRMPMLT